MTDDTAHHIEAVSFVFFLVFASLYLVSWLLFANNVLPSITGQVAIYADLPAVAAGILLLTTKGMRHFHFLSDEHRHLQIAVAIVVGTLFLGLVTLNIFAVA